MFWVLALRQSEGLTLEMSHYYPWPHHWCFKLGIFFSFFVSIILKSWLMDQRKPSQVKKKEKALHWLMMSVIIYKRDFEELRWLRFQLDYKYCDDSSESMRCQFSFTTVHKATIIHDKSFKYSTLILNILPFFPVLPFSLKFQSNVMLELLRLSVLLLFFFLLSEFIWCS